MLVRVSADVCGCAVFAAQAATAVLVTTAATSEGIREQIRKMRHRYHRRGYTTGTVTLHRQLADEPQAARVLPRETLMRI